jgi:protein CpxP
MNENKVIKLWRWTVLLLVLCNIGLMLTIWLKPVAGNNHPRPETPRDYIVRMLKFSEEQTRQYDVFVREHQHAMRQLRHEAMEYREQLFDNMKNDGKAGANADSLIQLIAGNQKQIETVTYKHFVQVRALCTDAQKTEFDNIIGDVMKKMSGGPHGGPPPPDDGPPPPDGPPHP